MLITYLLSIILCLCYVFGSLRHVIDISHALIHRSIRKRILKVFLYFIPRIIGKSCMFIDSSCNRTGKHKVSSVSRIYRLKDSLDTYTSHAIHICCKFFSGLTSCCVIPILLLNSCRLHIVICCHREQSLLHFDIRLCDFDVATLILYCVLAKINVGLFLKYCSCFRILNVKFIHLLCGYRAGLKCSNNITYCISINITHVKFHNILNVIDYSVCNSLKSFLCSRSKIVFRIYYRNKELLVLHSLLNKIISCNLSVLRFQSSLVRPLHKITDLCAGYILTTVNVINNSLCSIALICVKILYYLSKFLDTFDAIVCLVVIPCHRRCKCTRSCF